MTRGGRDAGSRRSTHEALGMDAGRSAPRDVPAPCALPRPRDPDCGLGLRGRGGRKALSVHRRGDMGQCRDAAPCGHRRGSHSPRSAPAGRRPAQTPHGPAPGHRHPARDDGAARIPGRARLHRGARHRGRTRNVPRFRPLRHSRVHHGRAGRPNRRVGGPHPALAVDPALLLAGDRVVALQAALCRLVSGHGRRVVRARLHRRLRPGPELRLLCPLPDPGADLDRIPAPAPAERARARVSS